MALSIRQKLFGGFGIVLALLVCATVVASLNMSTMHAKATKVASRDVPAVAALGTLAENLTFYRSTQLGHALSDTTELFTAREAMLKELDAAIATAFADYRPRITDAKERAYWTSAQRMWRGYKHNTASLVALDRAGKMSQGA